MPPRRPIRDRITHAAGTAALAAGMVAIELMPSLAPRIFDLWGLPLPETTPTPAAPKAKAHRRHPGGDRFLPDDHHLAWWLDDQIAQRRRSGDSEDIAVLRRLRGRLAQRRMMSSGLIDLEERSRAVRAEVADVLRRTQARRREEPVDADLGPREVWVRVSRDENGEPHVANGLPGFHAEDAEHWSPPDVEAWDDVGWCLYVRASEPAPPTADLDESIASLARKAVAATRSAIVDGTRRANKDHAQRADDGEAPKDTSEWKRGLDFPPNYPRWAESLTPPYVVTGPCGPSEPAVVWGEVDAPAPATADPEDVQGWVDAPTPARAGPEAVQGWVDAPPRTVLDELAEWSQIDQRFEGRFEFWLRYSQGEHEGGDGWEHKGGDGWVHSGMHGWYEDGVARDAETPFDTPQGALRDFLDRAYRPVTNPITGKRHCPDAAVCHHKCQEHSCLRIRIACPLSGAYRGCGESWPPQVMDAHSTPMIYGRRTSRSDAQEGA